LLCACSRYEDGMPMPVFKMPDTFAVSGLEYDVVTVSKLTKEALEFNVGPFFDDPELKKAVDQLLGRGSSQSNAQTSMNTSSDQSPQDSGHTKT
jgi:hypothetical protein